MSETYSQKYYREHRDRIIQQVKDNNDQKKQSIHVKYFCNECNKNVKNGMHVRRHRIVLGHSVVKTVIIDGHDVE